MSALAQYFLHEGAVVSGSDREASPTTAMLESKGIAVVIGQKGDNVAAGTELLVYSDAVPVDNTERERAAEWGIPQQSYFEALGEVAKQKRTVAVAGTHGKTTTTAMLGNMLIDAGLDPTVIVGSIVSEWGSNYRAPSNSSGQEGSGLLVVEACEYRNHFLNFRPELLVITNVEWDHTDFFKTPQEFEAAFNQARTQAAAVVDEAVYTHERVPELLVPGEFNRQNARAAKAAAKLLSPSTPEEVWDRSLAAYKGTWRRFEYKGQLPGGAQLYDDYAHHPTAISKTIAAARETFGDKKIVVFFHPHLYSRTRDLFSEFAAALAAADEAYILPVYAAREPHDPSVSHEALAAAITAQGGQGRAVGGMEETTQILKTLDSDSIAFTMGAGDVYKAGEAALK